MLRWILALVVVANLLFLAWSQHWLAPLGLAPEPAGEPYRLQQQVQPEAIVLRPVRPENRSRPQRQRRMQASRPPRPTKRQNKQISQPQNPAQRPMRLRTDGAAATRSSTPIDLQSPSSDDLR